MPKLKTKKSAKKRFKITGKGKVMRARACRRHILTKKSRKRKRGLRRAAVLMSTSAKTIRQIMPYD